MHMGRMSGETSTDKKQTLSSLHHVLASALQTLSSVVSLVGLFDEQHIARFIQHNFVYFLLSNLLFVAWLNWVLLERISKREDCCCVRWRVARKVKRELRCLSSSRCLREKNLCILNVSTTIYISISSRNKTRRFLFSLWRLHYVSSVLCSLPAQLVFNANKLLKRHCSSEIRLVMRETEAASRGCWLQLWTEQLNVLFLLPQITPLFSLSLG